MSSRRIFSVLAVLGFAGLLVWLLHGPARSVLHGEPRAASAPAGAASPVRVPAFGAASAAPPSAPAWVTAAAAPSAMPASGLHAAGHCGADEAPLPGLRTGGRDDVPAHPGSPRFLAANARLDAALRASTDPYLPAVAAWLDIPGASTPRQRTDQLVKLAQASADPRVYALAYGSCAGDASAPPSCRLLGARQWAQLDEGNGAAWVAVFDEARANGDVAGQDEALRAAAAATYYDARVFAPAAAVAGLFEDDDDMAAATGLAAANAFAKAAGRAVAPNALFEACRDHAGGNDERAALCDQVAGLMMAHPMDLLTEAVGSALDFATTRDPSRRDRVRAARAELLAAAASDAQWPAGLSECGQVHSVARGFRRAAEIGEAAAMRERHAAAAR